jgi:hypothetical protein
VWPQPVTGGCRSAVGRSDIAIRRFGGGRVCGRCVAAAFPLSGYAAVGG